MSKLLIALLALDIGVSLSKVYIFAWKSNNFEKRTYFFLKKRNNYLIVVIFLQLFSFISHK